MHVYLMLCVCALKDDLIEQGWTILIATPVLEL